MAIALGIDTGGTYTDAVLIRDEKDVLATAKSLTTRHDLAVGIGRAAGAVLTQAGIDPAMVSMASLSTTLATNALVEGQGGRVALIYVGFREQDLDRQDLRAALRGDPVVILAGGHDHAGHAAQPLDQAGLEDFLAAHQDDVSAFAVASRFAVRNPAHEKQVIETVVRMTGRPVSASHQLSAQLNGPKRALTAVLNARLLGMIDQLITRAEQQLGDMGISAPMMVVRGDGALVSAAQAREKPIETILSGPAASIVGACWLTGVQDAMVSDIGGTTTDVALLRNGRPRIDPAGARVGPYRTMVEAVAMRTTGLGGDSEVNPVGAGLEGGVILGPRRFLPVSLIATQAPEQVHAALDDQARKPAASEYDGHFVRRVSGLSAAGLGPREAQVLDRIGDDILPLDQALRNRVEQGALNRLVERGLVQIAGITPSDAAHVLGKLNTWDADAAQKALAQLARRRTGSGEQLASDAPAMAGIIIDQLTRQTSLALLEAAFAEDADSFAQPAEEMARHVLTQRGLAGHRGALRMDMGLNVPVVGLGASAPTYYPAAGRALNCQMILPEHAGVANAIGAVVGRITARRSGTITAPGEGLYRVHLDSGPEDFSRSDAALARLETALTELAEAALRQAGAVDIRMSTERDVKTITAEAREIFVEAQVTVEASGRPRITSD